MEFRFYFRKDILMKNLDDRIYDLFLDKGYDVKNNRNDTTRALNDMIAAGLFSDDISEKTFASYRKSIKDHVNGKVNSISYEWINIYCNFFGCSADYILGFIEEFTHDDEILKNHADNTLSSAAVRTLNRNKKYQLVTNAILETKCIDYLVQYIQYRFDNDIQMNVFRNCIKAEIASDENNNFKMFSDKAIKSFDDSFNLGWEKNKDSSAAVIMDSLWEKILPDINNIV